MTLKRGADARELAARALRESLSQGEFVPGQRLVEDELAEAFGITRSSLRQAIDTLVTEGLVERVKNRGARVRRLSIQDAVEITECRVVLEGLLARKAATNGSEKDIALLANKIKVMRITLDSGDILTYSRLIAELFDNIRTAARHPNATLLVERLQIQLVRRQFRLSFRPGRAQVSLEELARIVDAIATRKPAVAERLMRAHLEGTVAALTQESVSLSEGMDLAH